MKDLSADELKMTLEYNRTLDIGEQYAKIGESEFNFNGQIETPVMCMGLNCNRIFKSIKLFHKHKHKHHPEFVRVAGQKRGPEPGYKLSES